MVRKNIITAVIAATAAFALCARADVPGRSGLNCLPAINNYLHFDVVAASSFKPKFHLLISDKNPISLDLSGDAYFLKYQFYKKTYDLPPQVRQVCLTQAGDVYQGLLKYFGSRLTVLLAQKKIETFYIEATNVMAPRTQDNELSEIRHVLFDPIVPTYLNVLHEDLLAKLRHTPWAGYRNIPIELGSWNQEWQQLLQRQAPAGVELADGRIALRPLNYTPGELEMFLFHEISHLAGFRAGVKDAFENEVYAWRQTVGYIDDLNGLGKHVPELFENIRATIRSQGLRHWVWLVFQARRQRG